MDPVRAVATLALLAVALGAYLLSVRAYYRLRSPRPERVLVPTPDGTRIAVHHRRPEIRRFVEPVLLCHGLAANHVNFDFDPPHSLAHAFAAAGFEVFSVDWRGAGASRSRGWWRRYLYDADDLIAQDGPALLAHALQRTGAGSAFWVGHSLGALVGYGVLGGPEGGRIRGMCALGAPVFFRYTGWVVRLSRLALWLAWPLAFRQRWLSIGLAPFLGHVTLPLTEVLLNPRAIAPRVLRKMYCNLVSSMGYRLLRQLDDWSRHDAFRSRDGTRRLPGPARRGAHPGPGDGWEPGRPGDAAGRARSGGAARLRGQDGDALRPRERRHAGLRARRSPLRRARPPRGLPADPEVDLRPGARPSPSLHPGEVSARGLTADDRFRMQAAGGGATSPLHPSMSTCAPCAHSAHTAPSRLERAVIARSVAVPRSVTSTAGPAVPSMETSVAVRRASVSTATPGHARSADARADQRHGGGLGGEPPRRRCSPGPGGR